MAPSVNERRRMDYEVFPSWTRGDDSDDESRRIRSGIRREQRRRNRKRHNPEEDGIIRAETHQIDAATEFNRPEPTGPPAGQVPPPGGPPPPPPPPPPPATTTGDAGPSSSITEGAPAPTVPTATAAIPSDESSSITSVTTTTTTTTSTSETIPPLDQITETPAPISDPETDSESAGSQSGESGIDSGPSSSEDELGDEEGDDLPDEPDSITTPTDDTGLLPSETTATVGNTASATSTESSIPSLDAARQAQRQHHRNVETALTVVGSVCGVAFLAVGLFFFWRITKRRRRNRVLDGTDHVTLPPKPSRGARLLAKVPILRDRFGDSNWVSITETPAFEEKQRQPSQTPSLDLLGYMPDQPAPAALMAQSQRPMSKFDNGQEFYGAAGAPYGPLTGNPPSYYQTSPQSQDYQEQTFSSNDQLPRESTYQPSETGSSLSSAFGNGTHIPPTPMQPLHPPPAVRYNEPDMGAANNRRDTTYTQMSTASSIPRFRTIHSWVRQQTGRVPQIPEPQRENRQSDIEDGGQV